MAVGNAVDPNDGGGCYDKADCNKVDFVDAAGIGQVVVKGVDVDDLMEFFGY